MDMVKFWMALKFSCIIVFIAFAFVVATIGMFILIEKGYYIGAVLPFLWCVIFSACMSLLD